MIKARSNDAFSVSQNPETTANILQGLRSWLDSRNRKTVRTYGVLIDRLALRKIPSSSSCDWQGILVLEKGDRNISLLGSQGHRHPSFSL